MSCHRVGRCSTAVNCAESTHEPRLTLHGKRAELGVFCGLVLFSCEQAVTSDELYGHMTLAKEWKDGVLSIIMRNMSKVYRCS